MNFNLFYKQSFINGDIDCNNGYDYFFSAFDDCERTKIIFNKVTSKNKIWINFPHYNLTVTDKDSEIYNCISYKEDECFIELMNKIKISHEVKISIDITGFIRPHLIFFINLIHRAGIKVIDLFYSEPQYYKNAEDTTFSGFIDEVKLIEGCSSPINLPNTENDLLIITAGYDDKLLAKISQYKSKIKNKYYILGFPSLQPDMYQESILKLFNAKESIGVITEKYAPAFDPFVTAQTIQDIVNENSGHSNIYLSPLSTKPQALGVALYYLWNFNSKPVNIIFPYSKTYFPKTATGIKKTWKYTFELP